jgi:hypothetical protein
MEGWSVFSPFIISFVNAKHLDSRLLLTSFCFEKETNKPVVYAIVVGMIFIFTLAIFAIYDWNVSRRQTMVMNRAIKTQAVVSSLFPKSVQDRIMQDLEGEVTKENKRSSRKDQLKSFLSAEGNEMGNGLQNSKPIADLFVSTTTRDTISISMFAAPYQSYTQLFNAACFCLSYHSRKLQSCLVI